MKNVNSPQTVSFEDALRNLASKLTGRPAAELPRTQERIVQFMAENVPSVDEMGEAITQEVLARLAASADEDPPVDGDPPAGDGDGESAQDHAPNEPEDGSDESQTAGKAPTKSTRKTTKNS